MLAALVEDTKKQRQQRPDSMTLTRYHHNGALTLTLTGREAHRQRKTKALLDGMFGKLCCPHWQYDNPDRLQDYSTGNGEFLAKLRRSLEVSAMMNLLD